MMTFSSKTFFILFALAAFGVLTHWNFWDYGIYALGWNTSLYCAGVWCLLLTNSSDIKIRQDWHWIVPLWLVVASFSLYENPWLKLISLLILPVATGIFYGFGKLENKHHLYWNSNLITYLIGKAFSPFEYVGNATSYFFSKLNNLFGKQNSLNKRVLTGVAIFIPLSVIVISLLSSADHSFSLLIDEFLSAFFKHLSLTVFMKMATIIFSTIILLTVLHGWNKRKEYIEKASFKKIDDVITGIVISGILIIYLAFLALQLDYLIVNKLPIDFKQSEHLVKSGFWQLFCLSILNTIMFFIVYKNTKRTVQLILQVFIIASSLIVVSACWRMGMYVYYYGLSYEKFFASYTSLYALGLFIFLVAATFIAKRKNTLRFIAFSSLWFYAIASILPIERIIFYTNIKLTQQQETRLNLDELTDLSADIYHDVQKHIKTSRQTKNIWADWQWQIATHYCQRPLYETNLSLLLNCLHAETKEQTGWILNKN